jgi:hypothetical protein
MPYKLYTNWLFDMNRKSDIPKSEGIDIMKYNSPITATFVISMFIKNLKVNWFLNKNFNNMNLRYLEKEELFKFMKKCVFDFKLTRRDINYSSFRKQNKLFNVLRSKIPELKNGDIKLLCDIIEKSDEKDSVYNTLGLEVPKKMKLKTKESKKEKMSVAEFLERHFSIIKI